MENGSVPASLLERGHEIFVFLTVCKRIWQLRPFSSQLRPLSFRLRPLSSQLRPFFAFGGVCAQRHSKYKSTNISGRKDRSLWKMEASQPAGRNADTS